MIKFTATNKWYQIAAEGESGLSYISAGPSDLSISGLLENDVVLKKGIFYTCRKKSKKKYSLLDTKSGK